jgi:hypothetical protein
VRRSPCYAWGRMKKDRLQKLVRLASGAAVVGMGPLGACTPSTGTVVNAPPGGGPVINAPAPTATDTPTGAGDLADAGITLHPGVNAPPLPVPDLGAADGGAAPATSGSTYPNPLHRPHVNAPPGTAKP